MSRRKVFAVGVVSGALTALYGRLVYDNWRAYQSYDQAMTSLFNSVPENQRFGYTENFPENTRWSL